MNFSEKQQKTFLLSLQLSKLKIFHLKIQKCCSSKNNASFEGVFCSFFVHRINAFWMVHKGNIKSFWGSFLLQTSVANSYWFKMGHIFQRGTIPHYKNYRIFLSLRFYVKSKLVNLPFQQSVRLWIMNFCTFWRLKFNKLTKFRSPKMAKIDVLDISTICKIDFT